MSNNILCLRLEGPLQAWGNNEAKFAVRRSGKAPTKSGVIGILCAALGVPREEAADKWLPKLSKLHMGVRIDRPGVRWWDYHTVGAGLKMPIAEKKGKTKSGAMLTRREYLADASFLVALQNHGEDGDLMAELSKAIAKPVWPVYLGRKCCPSSRPLLEDTEGLELNSIEDAMVKLPWQPRNRKEPRPSELECLIEWIPREGLDAPDDAEMWYDSPISFAPPGYHPRLVESSWLRLEDDVPLKREPFGNLPNKPLRPHANYTNSEYKKAREKRMKSDHGLCVFCKVPGTTVQHITYRRAGGNEEQEDLRTLCRLCHDAVTMLEYGHGMGMERINPEAPEWREKIISRRKDILNYRSRAIRQRHLNVYQEEEGNDVPLTANG